MREATPTSPRRVLAHAGALVALGVTLGAVLNALSSQPVPLGWVSKTTRMDRAMAAYGAGTTTGEVPTLTLVQVEAMRGESGVLLVDARAASTFSAGRIPGAVRLARDRFDSEYGLLRERFTAARAVIVYCAGPECHEAERVAGALLRLGHARVHLFSGGWRAWDAAGLPKECDR